MKITTLLFATGVLLTGGWLYFYAYSTIELTLAVLKNNPYYFDVVPLYLLPYAIAPFVTISYIEGIKKASPVLTLPITQRMNFILLTCFAFLQAFLGIAFFLAFFSTFEVFELSLELFWLLLPFSFLTFFLLLVCFLLKTRHSLKSTNKC
jgi:hypothetical protein